MKADLEIGGQLTSVHFGDAIDVSIPLCFNEDQPNAYGVPMTASSPCRAGELVGDTRRGGSCNFEQYTFITHCNGTHTECVGHITHERLSVRDCLRDVFMMAVLISVEPVAGGDTNDEYAVDIQPGDRLITAQSLRDALREADTCEALIVRTLPNDDSKLTNRYGEENIPAYFSTDAMKYIVEMRFRHLLVDLPSIDRLFDDGRLSNHRIFWGIEPGSFEVNADTRGEHTISELIYVPAAVADAEYLLNLQIAPFQSDAAPSRPMLFRINQNRSHAGNDITTII